MSWLGSGERSCCGFLCAQTEYKSFIMGRHRRGPELLLAWSKVPERRKKEREKREKVVVVGGGGLSSNFIITLGVCHSCAVTLLFCCDGTDSSLWNSVKLSCLLIQTSATRPLYCYPPVPPPRSLSYGNVWFLCKRPILLEWFFRVDSQKIRPKTWRWGVTAPRFLYVCNTIHFGSVCVMNWIMTKSDSVDGLESDRW